MRKCLTTLQFIEKAKEIHGSKYNYSKVKYTKSREKVCIICNEHGEFWQTPFNHLLGKGCPKCGKARADNKQLMLEEDFKKKARLVHSHMYSYSKVKYTGCFNKVTITCPIHGDFYQTPAVHLLGSGCPICKKSKGERMVRSILNSLKIPFNELVKLTIYNKEYFIDFVVYLNNKTYYIEYNGRQHYMPVDRFGGTLRFAKLIQRDNTIRSYCKDSKVKLIEIPYNLNKDEISNLIINSIKNE